MGGVALTRPKEVVGIIHSQAILMDDIRVHSVIRDASTSGIIGICVRSSIMDSILGIEQISSRQSEFLPWRLPFCHSEHGNSNRSLDLSPLLASRALSSRWLEIAWK